MNWWKRKIILLLATHAIASSETPRPRLNRSRVGFDVRAENERSVATRQPRIGGGPSFVGRLSRIRRSSSLTRTDDVDIFERGRTGFPSAHLLAAFVRGGGQATKEKEEHKSSKSAPSSNQVPVSSDALRLNDNYSLKRGVQTTGAGASRRNPSIFSASGKHDASIWTTSALAGDVLNRSSKSSKSKSSKVNPMLGKMWGGVTDKGTLVIKLANRDGGYDLIELKESDDQAKLDARFVSEEPSILIPIEGIYGVYNLPFSGPHVVLITESEHVYSSPTTQTNPNPLLVLRQVKKMEIYPLRHVESTNRLSPPEQPAEELRQLKLLRKSFKEHDLYFTVPSGDGGVVKDVTHTLQRSFQHFVGGASESKWWDADPDTEGDAVDGRFFWNEKPAHSMIPSEPDECGIDSPFTRLLETIVPVTSAFVGVQSNIPIPASSNKSNINEEYDQLLISRRSKFRTGTRFTRRGADGTGAVANYAETEQICFITNPADSDKRGRELAEVYSHVQTRGSIPLHWSSPAEVKTYRPHVFIGVDPDVQARGLQQHLSGELKLYASRDSSKDNNSRRRYRRGDLTKIAMVNLIDKHGDQGRLGVAFDAVLSKVLRSQDGLADDSVKHIWFDFHAECSGGRWDKLVELLKQVIPALDRQGYFCVVPHSDADAPAWSISSYQDGVVRSNCMDCLDRTNVVQSMFGRYALYRQLHERPGLKSSLKRFRRRTLPVEMVVGYKQQPLTLPWKEGEAAHRYLWADNADAISRLYAGTPALKGDFTRTGKRTKRGAIDDGMNSLQRYYLNNFIDADRQEGMELLVGNSEFDSFPSESGDDEARLSVLKRLSRDDIRGYHQSHARIKVEAGDKVKLLRNRMKSEEIKSRFPSSSAADEEGVDAKSSSDFLLRVSASAAGEENLELIEPWWLPDDFSDAEPEGCSAELAKDTVGRKESILPFVVSVAAAVLYGLAYDLMHK